ncbi:MAG: ATP-binding protein [Oligoflexia bacterium]|nr:ATP-binding protein [Oligoflexia bacterium]
MIAFIPRRLRAFFKLSSQRLISGLGLSLRLLFCFAVGFILLLTNQSNYDMRFALRGPQQVKNDIVLINLSREDVVWLDGINDYAGKNSLWSLKEIVETTDSFFWHAAVWERALSSVFNAGAKTAVVTLFFSEEIVRGTLTPHQNHLFHRPGIFWAAKSDSSGHALLPGLATTDGRNTGTVDLRTDPDGKIRHLLSASYSTPHIGVRVANFVFGKNKFAPYQRTGDPINFQGHEGIFKSYPFSALLKHDIPNSALKDKIIIFTAKGIPSHQFQTAVGELTTGTLLANIIHNFISNKWITKLPIWFNATGLLLVMLISLWIIFQYPQSVAFVFLGFLAVSIISLSIALFDLYAIWMPIQAHLVTILVTYVVISGYRLSESEKLTWESERELHYLSQVESLKNNFLSLISHDLKNPLAKIQGITDRLLGSREVEIPKDVKQDLTSIRQISEELRQYITSILQLTRVEARNIKLTKEVCDINSMIQDVVDRIKPLADQKNIQIKINLEPLFSMELDRTLISEVLINLIENAIKYSDAGSEITLTTLEMGPDIRVEVSDNGRGIPEEEIPKVFEKFYRVSGDKNIQVTGTGLGLYLVKYFIELHGGKVFITSQLDIGTKIGFTLPLEEPEDNYAEFTRTHR